ncbi:MAG: undecaprenyl/decaprenyl-phosphate alpha-N-acetylglucosaminyl 1-phosphate transferase [Turicibacter sp.]|nr:undecaprenyl/decaprenyl-phosphate alpha-N-acetylglucosaminyl 1-phosphate transferase [Turicibacter sp.]
MIFLLVIGFCFLVSVFTTPYMVKLSHFTGAIDKPNKRKIHGRIMPRLGGLAIFIAFILGYMVFDIKETSMYEGQTAFFDAYLISSVLIIGAGMLDDMFDLPAKAKFLVQLTAALIMVFYGNFLITDFHWPIFPSIYLGWFGGVVTILWIVGITNSMNLIDGLDGLSSGISAITFTTMGVLSIYQGDFFVAMLCFLLLGSTLGFLVHNFYPAKIFMGDTGSMFLGFSISVLSLLGYKNAAFVSFIIPIIMLSVPIFDTVWALVRRLLSGESPFKPDRNHVHHFLLNKNLGHVKSVLVLYAITALFSLTAIVYTMHTTFWGLIMLVICVVIIELIFNTTGAFRYKEKEQDKKIEVEQVRPNEETGHPTKKSTADPG